MWMADFRDEPWLGRMKGEGPGVSFALSMRRRGWKSGNRGIGRGIVARIPQLTSVACT